MPVDTKGKNKIRGSGKRNLGDYGEAAAIGYLKEKGFEILHTNYRIRGGEIDIIARDGAYLVFVEVKYRRSADYGAPAEALTTKKLHRLRTAAEKYINDRDYDGDCRFDAILITGGEGYIDTIEHIKNITG